MKDLRHYRRLPDHIDVRFRIISLGENPGDYIELRGSGQSENISEGGMLFEVGEIIPLGSFLEIEFNVSGLEYPVFLRGRVVRVEEIVENKKYDIGIMFTHYFEKDRDMLKAHLSDLIEHMFES